MRYYLTRQMEFKILEKTPISPERLEFRFGLTQDGSIIVLFGKPVPDLLLTPQEAVAFVEAMNTTIAQAKKIRSRKT